MLADSHPKFNRNDPDAKSLIKRVKKGSNAKATNKRKSNQSHRLALKDGEQSFMFPSLANNQLHMTEGDSSVFGTLYQMIRSQIADRTQKALIRLPPGAHFVSSDKSGDDDSADGQSRYKPRSSSKRSGSFQMPSDNNMTTSEQLAQRNQIAQNSDAIFDDDIAPILLEGYASEEDDLEPLPWSPQHTTMHGANVPGHSEDEALLISLEPRSIQEMAMNGNSEDLNSFFEVLPVFPTPRYQALYDYSSPIALPVLFYMMDISSFGMYWATFLIAGHTIQSLFTEYGPNTGDLVLNPKISLGKHLFMDVMWVQLLLSAMILVPEYFGSSSVMLANAFLLSNPPSLGMSLKSHYHHFHSQKKRQQFVYGDWWLADIIKWLFVGYLASALFISLGQYLAIPSLRVVGVFLMNLTPYLGCESYRLLLSIPSTLEDPRCNKKDN